MAQLDADNDDAADAATSDHRSLKSNGSVHDPDAQQMVITSLRTQIQDLVGQVAQLNNKLVKSYNHVSDLEDELHISSSHLRNSSIKISQLELERSQHLSALSTGLLVEKSHVTTELTRLMEKATEEAAHRGQAESARAAIEIELDDLSANLFNQANTMVAEARYAQHVSERKMEEAESALKGAEEAVGVMQQQLQVLREEKESAEKKAQEVQVSAGKTQWVERHNGVSITRSLRLLSSHSPYQDFLLFVAHLRTVHTSTPHLPSMSTLLNLPFLQRVLIEDSEPTVRLDLAPALNWLSRRSVLAAIHNGQLVIEPCSAGSLLSECHGSSMGGSSNDISCALCGTPVLSKDDVTRSLHTYPLTTTRSNGTNNLWSSSLFRKSYSNPYSGSNPPTPSSPPADLPQIFVFRIGSNPSTIPIPSLPIPTSTPPPLISHSSSNSQSFAAYPLCRSGWCLGRLRTTCSLWSFVRVSLVEKIWEEEVPVLPPPPPKIPVQAETSKPPLPPRKRGLWGMASVLGERASTWSEAAKKIAPSSQPEQQAPQEIARKASTEKQAALPSMAAAASASTMASHATNHLKPPEQARASSPPSIPKRSGGRVPPRKTASPAPIRSGGSAPTNQLPNGAATVYPKETGKEPTASPEQKLEASAIPPAPSPSPAPPVATASNAPSIPPRASGHKRHSSALPERIPLPDSRPGTPLNGGPPSRTTSPAPGTGAPPPIPRRAAARGTRLVNSGDAGSRPGTPPIHTSATGATTVPTSTVSVPAPIPEAETKPDAWEKAEVGGTESTGAGVTVVSTTAAVAGAEQVQREGALEVAKLFEAPRITVAMSETSSASPTTEDWKSVAVTPIGTGSPLEEATPCFEDKSPQTTLAATDTQTQPKSQEAPPAEASASNVESQDVRSSSNGSVIVSSGGEEEELIPSDKSVFGSSKAASPLQSGSSVGLGVAVMEVLSSNVQPAEEKEGYKEVYVGDATWEERTWKELVRLREDMFWARIGGLR